MERCTYGRIGENLFADSSGPDYQIYLDPNSQRIYVENNHIETAGTAAVSDNGTNNVVLNNHGASVDGTTRAFGDDATPSVAYGNIFLTGGTTTITDFDDGNAGKIITIIAEHSITITDGTNIFLSGSANWAMTATDTLTLVCKADNKWYEISRSDSGA